MLRGRTRRRLALPVGALLASLLVGAPEPANGQTLTAAWDPSPTQGVTAYQVCLGTSSLRCDLGLASVGGNLTSYTFTPVGGVLTFVAVRAMNSSGYGSYSTEVSFSIPSLARPPDQLTRAGVPIAPLDLSVSDPDRSPLAFTHTGLPVGLTLNPTTGQITGVPSAAGAYDVTVFVSDALATVSRTFLWTGYFAGAVRRGVANDEWPRVRRVQQRELDVNG